MTTDKSPAKTSSNRVSHRHIPEREGLSLLSFLFERKRYTKAAKEKRTAPKPAPVMNPDDDDFLLLSSSFTSFSFVLCCDTINSCFILRS